MAENFKTDFFTDRIGRGIQDNKGPAVAVLYASLIIALLVFLMDLCFQNFMEKIIYPH